MLVSQGSCQGSCQVELSWICVGIPSGYVKITIENGHRNSVFTH